MNKILSVPDFEVALMSSPAEVLRNHDVAQRALLMQALDSARDANALTTTALRQRDEARAEKERAWGLNCSLNAREAMLIGQLDQLRRERDDANQRAERAIEVSVRVINGWSDERQRLAKDAQRRQDFIAGCQQIIGTHNNLQAAIAELMDELDRARALNRKMCCAYCGHTDSTDGIGGEEIKRKIAEHILLCEKHPTNAMARSLSVALHALETLAYGFRDMERRRLWGGGPMSGQEWFIQDPVGYKLWESAVDTIADLRRGGLSGDVEVRSDVY